MPEASEHHRRRLLAERANLLQRIAWLDANGLDRAETASSGELSSYDNHPADQGTETFEREKDLGRKVDLRSFLAQVDDALERLDNGTYGICQRCGQPIDPARLEAVPWADLCLACKSAASSLAAQRPVEEEVLGTPFYSSFRGKDPGLTGEDIWQAVARYGNSDGPQDLLSAEDYEDIDDDHNDGVVAAVEGVADETGDPLRHHNEEMDG